MKFTEAVTHVGFTQSKCDYSLYSRGSSPTFIAILLYADDIILTSPSQQMISEVKQFLSSVFV